MRKRGFIWLTATLPVWALALYLDKQIERAEQIQNWTITFEPSDFVVGVNWAAVIGSVASITILIVDFASWLHLRKCPQRSRMRISTLSRVLIFGSALAPLTILGLRVSSLEHRRIVAASIAAGLHFHYSGVLPLATFLLGLICFAGFLASLSIDYVRSRQRQ